MILRSTNGGCILSVRVHPSVTRNAIIGTRDGALNISLTTPSGDGRANAALVAFIAERLNIPRLSVKLFSGATSRSKTLRLIGITAPEAEARLLSDPA